MFCLQATQRMLSSEGFSLDFPLCGFYIVADGGCLWKYIPSYWLYWYSLLLSHVLRVPILITTTTISAAAHLTTHTTNPETVPDNLPWSEGCFLGDWGCKLTSRLTRHSWGNRYTGIYPEARGLLPNYPFFIQCLLSKPHAQLCSRLMS